MMTYIGIDPGLDGAVAKQDSFECRVYATPTVRISRGRDYDEPAMRAILEGTLNPTAIIEKQQSMPGQGVRSTFMTGGGYYIWRGLLSGLGIPYEIVTARRWQKLMHGVASGDPKGRSIMACKRLFPTVSLLKSDRCRTPHDGIADALLIAEYGRRIHLGSPGTELRLEAIEPMTGANDGKKGEQ